MDNRIAPPRGRPWVESITFTSVGAGSASSGTIPVSAEGNFMVYEISFYFASTPSPDWTANIVDEGSSRAIFDAEQYVENVFSTRNYRRVLPRPLLFPANTTIRVEVTNRNAGAETAQISFIGEVMP